MGIESGGGKKGGNNVVRFESPNSSAPDREIVHNRVRSVIAQMRRELESTTLMQDAIEQGRKTYETYEIPELETMLLAMPVGWKTMGPERWLALTQVLEKKYAERDNNQAP